ncbi:hypothetical protein DL768_006800 [Monosporascus sp. mg162]|nr:hypothetical protein DL768_006800 [Monosporascus sp. mg162]
MRLNFWPAITALVVAAVHASTLTPSVLPLIVRNPYLSIWFNHARGYPWTNWPMFWTGSTVGFAVMAAMPDSNTSLPAGYLTAFVEGSHDVSIYIDVNGEWVSGNRKNQIVWNFGKSTGKRSGTPIKTWSIRRRDEQLLTEFYDHAEWGTIHVSAPAGVEHQSGEAHHVRRQFAQDGSLKNRVDEAFRGIFEEEPIFAFSKTFKLRKKSNSTSAAKDSVRFTFALTQDPVAQFAAARGLTQMRPLWASYFHSAEELLQYHFDDYATAAFLAHNYSEQLAKDAYASGSRDYQDIVALSARQVLGATQFSGTPDSPLIFLKEISSDGNFQTVDVIFPAFPFFLYTNPRWLEYLLEPLLEHQKSGQYPNDYSMHDLGAHFPNATGHPDGRDEYMPLEECGNMLIMALALANAFKDNPRPTFSQTAPGEAIALAAGPVRRPNSVDAYGMDRSFEEIGTTGEKAAIRWLARSYKLWKQWTRYLVEEALVPANQLCTDDFAGPLPNQTNLALKGIVGIKAMSELAALVGEKEEAKYYGFVAEEYIKKWQDYGLSSDKSHAKLSYTWRGSWTTLYNIYADALLCFHLPEDGSSLDSGRFWNTKQAPIGGASKPHFIPDKIYKAQSDWYYAVLQRYGLPMDSRHLYTKSDWEFFSAAVTSKKVRTEILQHVAKWVNESTTDRPMTDLYDTEGTGHFPGIYFMARPVVGGHFAFLALERACGGKAVEGLKFLDEGEPTDINVQESLMADIAMLDKPARKMGEL